MESIQSEAFNFHGVARSMLVSVALHNFADIKNSTQWKTVSGGLVRDRESSKERFTNGNVPYITSRVSCVHSPCDSFSSFIGQGHGCDRGKCDEPRALVAFSMVVLSNLPQTREIKPEEASAWR
jgi:hypothetical protein